MLDAERTRCLLGECIAVSLAIRRPDEGGDDLEAPVGHVDSLAPEIGEAEVDIELE